MTKVGFISLGCPKNLVDSEVMMGILAREGYELTPRADEAEILVVNTCSFIEPAQKESVDAILEMAEHKKFGAAKKLIVAGCLVERYRDQILEQVPEVDAVVGTGEVERILEAVEGDLRDASRGAAGVSVPRPDAARDHHAAARRVHQDRRRLRSSVHVLHYSAAAREISQPAIRVGGARGGEPGGFGRARDYADRAGHDFVRRGLGFARRVGAAAWSGWRRWTSCCGCAFCTRIRIA